MRGIKTILQKGDKQMKRKPTRILARYQERFILFSKRIRRERFQIFKNIGPNFRTNIYLKKS